MLIRKIFIHLLYLVKNDLIFHHTGYEVMTMHYGARAKDWITDSDIKQKKLAGEFQISEAMLSNYLTGRSEIPVDVLVKIAQYFGISMDYLTGLSDDPHRPMTLTAPEQEMVNNFRHLTRDQQELILHNIRFMLEQNQK